MMGVWQALDGNDGRPGMVRTPEGVFWWAAPTFDLTKRGYRWFKRIVPPAAYVEYKSDRMFKLRANGAELWYKSGDSDSLVGEGVNGLVIDEAARFPKDKYEMDLRATLSDTKGWGVFFSVPRGRNWFHGLYTRGQDREKKGWFSIQLPTASNPEIDPDELQEARETLPSAIFEQEYEAKFLEDGAGVFRKISACVKGKRVPPQKGHTYSAGVDLGKHEDFTVIYVLDNFTGAVVEYDRFNEISWPLQKQRIIRLCKAYQAATLIDSTGIGDPIFDDLSNAGLNVDGYLFTNPSKTALVENLSITIEQEGISFPMIPELIHELEIFEYEILRSGRVRYQAPPGYHDDCVMALALAAWKRQHPVRAGWIA